MALPAALFGAEVPGDQDFTIRQGDTFKQPIRISLNGGYVDLTAITPASKIRDAIGGNILVAFTATVTDAANGEVTLALTPAQTAALTAPVSSTGDQRTVAIGYYDIELSDGTDKRTFIGGKINLYREVTV